MYTLFVSKKQEAKGLKGHASSEVTHAFCRVPSPGVCLGLSLLSLPTCVGLSTVCKQTPLSKQKLSLLAVASADLNRFQVF